MKYLDLAVLKPPVTSQVISEAIVLIDDRVASICVPPNWIKGVKSRVECPVSTVIGYPYGYADPIVKIMEAEKAIQDGADELDIVVDYHKFLHGSPITPSLKFITTLAHANNVLVKAILETCFYTERQLKEACRHCNEAGVDFVKTSTGVFGGATEDAVKIILDNFKGKVKASGGITTPERAKYFLEMGCTRIGASKLV